MSQLRFDDTTSNWVVFAPLRKLRPHDGAASPPAPESLDAARSCPFCPGNEELAQRVIDAIRSSAGGHSWKVRGVPNKFPALRIERLSSGCNRTCRRVRKLAGWMGRATFRPSR
jgi:galactose-1-phosphate uridylyltransferase